MLWRFAPAEGDGDEDKPTCDTSQWTNPQKESQTQFTLQIIISSSLGLFAILMFCMLRPKWKSLYAARTRYINPSIGIPVLPDTFFGWIRPVYRITDAQVMRAAGLDALCFLTFFRMASKMLGIMLVFALVILMPIYHAYDDTGKTGMRWILEYEVIAEEVSDNSYLWVIPVFTFFFTYVTFQVMDQVTIQFIRIRQNYLATQPTITARTFRLEGIAKGQRSKQAIKALIEGLGIGKVQDVQVCRIWERLDALVKERDVVKRKLERAYASYHKASDVDANNVQLLGQERPTTWIWSSWFSFQRVDAIDHYQQQLDVLDDRIREERMKDHEAVDLAFVTMDSIEACQMAAQAVLDPHPGLLVTKLAPSPTDIEWENTYASRSSRALKSLAVTLIVTLLTIIWLVPVGLFASVASICTIETTLPSLFAFLKEHSILRAFVQSGLPTIAVASLNAIVPFFYDYLSHRQGMISRADVELSLISKNFFFIFFNVFLMFTVFGTVGSIADVIRDSFKDTTYLASTLAGAIVRLGDFYTNLIVLNSIGILPFRLLQAGSVFTYPYYKFFAKTPRERAELARPDVFSFGFHLPMALFVFMLSLVYSVLPGGYWLLGFGLLYFVHGFFTYKYQLVYAMNQSQHADGAIWPMICNRIMLALFVFQLTMSGFLALRKAYWASLSIVPLLPVVMWRAWVYKRKYEPLTRFIALQGIKRGDGDYDDDDASAILENDDLEALNGSGHGGRARRASTYDEEREQGLRFVNPSLVVRCVYFPCSLFSHSLALDFCTVAHSSPLTQTKHAI
ncbi:DUF221 domain containing protein [Naviculisporaceae sp. PSN 640]